MWIILFLDSCERGVEVDAAQEEQSLLEDSFGLNALAQTLLQLARLLELLLHELFLLQHFRLQVLQKDFLALPR